MKIERDVDLSAWNTFGLRSVARQYAVMRSIEDANGLTKSDNIFLLGGGSNIILPPIMENYVIHNRIEFIEADDIEVEVVFVEAGAGVTWHDLVRLCVNMNWAGIENLALIPGSVGAAPVQNIGAYGVELKDVFHALKAYDLDNECLVEMKADECNFGYRTSTFKSENKGRFIILTVTLKLNKTNYIPQMEYTGLKQECQAREINHPSIRDMFDMVVAIRSKKLPDPAVIGNCGSFFKNPIISKSEFSRIQAEFADMKYYLLDGGLVKLPAGYLIDMCGWKGRRIGNVGCYEKQALVIVNHGSATAAEIYNLVSHIKNSVMQKFGIELQEEVNLFK